MDPAAPTSRLYDPARHDSHIIALFTDEAAAVQARSAVIQAGLLPDIVVIMADGAALHSGLRHPVQDLFVPEDDYHDYHHALGRGHALLIVRPVSVETREAAVAIVEQHAPLDMEQHGRKWRGTAQPADRFSINHASVCRADMAGRAIGGHDEVILDMTGQKMTVRRMSDEDMAAAPFTPILPPQQRPAPLASPVPARDVPVSGTSYTYGVPADVVQRMSPQEQVMAQPHTVEIAGDLSTQATFLRVVDGQTRLGWRERHPAATRIRSYVTERPIDHTA